MENLMLHAALSFLVAGVWITTATVLSEKLGSRVGGLISNLPSNGLVSLLFIGLSQTPEFAAQAAKAFPAGMIIDSIFLFVLIAASIRYGRLAFALALASWFALAVPLGTYGYGDLAVSTLVYVSVTIGLFYVLERRMRIKSVKRKNHAKHSAKELLIRGLLSGGIVAIAVVMAALFGPFWGGIFSVFPAVMFSTMYLLTQSQGFGFARATGKVMLPASANIVVYGLAVSLTYPTLGLLWGTVTSYAAAAATVLLMYPLMTRVS